MFEETVLPPTAKVIEKAQALVQECEVPTESPVWNTDLLSQNIPRASWPKAIPERIERCVHDLIYERVLEQPNAPAVCSWDGDFTYYEVDQWSSALAKHLHAEGVVAEVIIPILIEKSRWTTIAILAILKTGGAFTLLDPSLPPDRLKEMVQRLQAPVILVSPHTVSLQAHIGPRPILVDEENCFHQNLSENQTWQAAECHPNNAAYALFTSGSTGKPKALVMEHAAICSSFLWSGRATGLDKSDRILQFSSHSFDIATYDHLMTLIFGGCICIPSEEDRKGDIAGAANRLGVTYAVMTPTVSRLIEPQMVPTLKVLVTTGESMTVEDIQRWEPFVRLVNMYGPAETGCSISVNDSLSRSNPGNIGYSTGAIVWIVDPENFQCLQPVGEVGELVAQGHNVARGYLRDPVKSQEAFIENPTWLRQNEQPSFGRLYRTGDLARYNPKDGSLQFLGRKDTQVKIHGQRIELGEVEYQLKRGLRGEGNVVVDLIVNDSQKPNLVGFVSSIQEAQSVRDKHDSEDSEGSLFVVPSDQFRAQARTAMVAMRKVLPSYMIPSDLMQLSYLPVTGSGKTDRRQVRLHASALNHESRRKYSSLLAASRDLPSSPMEERLEALWLSTLGLSRGEIGVHDNFFNLGATSVDAIRLCQRACQEGLGELTPARIFESPTIESLAITLRNNSTLTLPTMAAPEFRLDPSLVAELLHQAQLKTDDIEAGVFPVTCFQRKWLQHACVHMAFELPAHLDHTRLEAAWAVVTERHPALRSVYVTHGAIIYQMFLREADRTIPIERCTQSLSEYAETYCNQDATRSIPDGSQYWRLTRLVDDEKCSMLVVRANHAQFDAISLQIIFKDFVAAYSGDELPKLALDFPTYMLHRLHQNGSSNASGFWKDFLSRSSMTRPKLLEEPDQPAGDIVSVVSFKEIPEVIPPLGITMGSLMRAAWAFVLSQYTHKEEVVFGEVTEGRAFPLIDIMGIVGCAAGESPMRIVVPRTGTVHDFLRYSQQQHARRIAYETSDFNEIVQQCTDWSSVDEFSTSLVLEYPDPLPSVTLDGHECKQRVFLHGVPKDIYMQVIPMSDKCQLAMSGSNMKLSKDIADVLVERLAATLIQFSSMLDRPIVEVSV